ncbi:MAG: amino acid permease [Gammaproteobacteria bacterium]|nr:MAG: amino acid permease [Gammaproteobacteria bacterium]
MKKQLSVFSLVMINVIAIDSLRTLPMGAEYGFSLVFYYLLAALTFFLPTALVAAELATGWPETGGIYVWVREAFGKKIGFMTIWLQWFYNVCWYPTIMSFIAATIAYCIDPNLVNDKIYMLTVIISLFWLSTFLNFLGMEVSSLMSTIAAIAGTLAPMLLIIILGTIWMLLGHPIHVDFSWHSFFPNLNNINNLVLLTGILYGLVGIEMSASHASDVQNPQRDYPKAAVWSGILIVLSLVLASLAIALVIPQNQLNIIAGLLQAFDVFFQAFHIGWFTPILAVLIICGALGGVNAWILGPGKGLLIASRDGCLPAFLSKTNRHGVPTSILLIQAIIFTGLCSIFLLFPTVSSSFWVLSDVTSILSLIVYIAMFTSALRLRYKFPHVKRAFIIPGGKIGLWSVCLVGLVSCIFTIGIGFLPPSQIPVGNLTIYELILGAGVVIGCLLPFGLYKLTSHIEKNQRASMILEGSTE